MSVTTFRADEITLKDQSHNNIHMFVATNNTDESVPFDYRDIINFITKEVYMPKFQADFDEKNFSNHKVNAINFQILTLISITAIYMLIINMIAFLDK